MYQFAQKTLLSLIVWGAVNLVTPHRGDASSTEPSLYQPIFAPQPVFDWTIRRFDVTPDLVDRLPVLFESRETFSAARDFSWLHAAEHRGTIVFWRPAPWAWWAVDVDDQDPAYGLHHDLDRWHWGFEKWWADHGTEICLPTEESPGSMIPEPSVVSLVLGAGFGLMALFRRTRPRRDRA